MRLPVLSLLAALAALTLALSACGSSDDGGCPGITCTNCSASGDCNISCPGTEVCIGHPNGDPNLRCAYCE